MTTDDNDLLENQPIPSESNCPYCGGLPTDESVARHRLSDLGYLHDDIALTCDDCDQEWPCGVPIGEYDGAGDLFCDSCQSRFMRVHRVDSHSGGKDGVVLHLKCPNQECFYFKKISRATDNGGIALVGYPDITGDLDTADAWGYPETAPPGTPIDD